MSIEKGTLLHSPPVLIKDGSADLSFSSLHSLHCRYKDALRL